ncbi:MAG: transposase, partial [Proteobacteria bacterium]|nr:transposase [Pseudomonadota bacterium]
MGKKQVSDICDAHGIQPSLFYSWLRQLHENMEAALQDGRGKGNGILERKVDELEQKLAKKDAVIAKKERVIAEI